MIIEKGKGPVIGKLRNIQLIEADLQLLIMIFMGAKSEKLIKKEMRLSTANYGSRKNYSVELAILEKRLIYDSYLLQNTPLIHKITNLQLCYDQQLANFGSIIEESVGNNRYALKLFTKLIPV